MSEFTGVYLITGFLGSGKTTFLNRIIDRFPKDKKLTILMNEFGEIGVDGTLIEGDEIDMMEISKGSIFCVCVKTDFIKGLYELNATVQPDVLLIESTGVANPTDLKRDLELPIFDDRFQFVEQFCIIDAAHFLDAYNAYASLEKQIASSTVFIINKTDLASAETIEEVKQVVRQFHPDPYFFETSYADIPLEQFLFPEEGATKVDEEQAPKRAERRILSEGELDTFIDDLLDDPNLEITPPDRLSSVVRAKGFIEEKGKIYVFNYVMGDWTIKESRIARDRIEHMNVVVFIGPPESMEGIEKASKTGHWSSMGAFQPMSQVKED